MKYKNNFNPSISDEVIFDEILEEKKSIGYYNLPFCSTADYKTYAKTVTQKNIVVIGIGGSTLGTYAIYKFLKHSRDLDKNLLFLETTDPIDIKAKVASIDLSDTLFVVISKSGTTVETIAIFKYINALITCNSTNTVVVTEDGSKLKTFAEKNNIRSFKIPKNVGGRFSVFSAVGLLPLAIVGIDIDKILQGAQKSHDNFFQKKEAYERLLKKARFLVEYKNSFNINVVFSYSSRLEGFNKWYIQLWGESLGKVDSNSVRQGLTPVGIIGPIDQHSFLQLVIEGKRDKTLTVIKVENFDNDLKIPSVTLDGLEEMDYLDNLNFSSLIKNQADATIEAINNLHDIPCDVITIEGINESAIAALMYEFELLTSLCGKFMHVNTYNQPGVESGKVILKNKLNKGDI
ncbi:glucose-6-phosphate isomerase [Sulfurimonas sediminis]|uniref:Glucose-6-phosphate isomerase n=1 Tax=Sulfurimonas sediminis TaxID=2590020 RepID=A0A7M1AYX0_9BACT|nr:glucose-6-phosphate isomerase [Sulfurimonas sediminis]QOP42641.1 glucose-6-phosphate isomerase [Sulfurimonas sediminis]